METIQGPWTERHLKNTGLENLLGTYFIPQPTSVLSFLFSKASILHMMGRRVNGWTGSQTID